MKKILKVYIIELLSLYFLTQILSGLQFEGGIKTFLLTALALTLATYSVKPIINLFILPLNLITFGLFRWLSSAIILFLITQVITNFKIEKFFFPGFKNVWVDIPQLNVSGIGAIILYSLALSILSSIFRWLFK